MQLSSECSCARRFVTSSPPVASSPLLFRCLAAEVWQATQAADDGKLLTSPHPEEARRPSWGGGGETGVAAAQGVFTVFQMLDRSFKRLILSAGDLQECHRSRAAFNFPDNFQFEAKQRDARRNIRLR